jgi:hypothetical protein
VGEAKERTRPTYVVLHEVSQGTWQLVGEVARRPGYPARRGRAQAVADALGREPSATEHYKAVARSEWLIGSDW